MKRSRCRAGFSLVETVIALGITSFCLVSILGLLLTGLHASHGSTQQTAAATIANEVIADLKAAPAATSMSPQFQISIPTAASTLPTTPTTFYIENDGTSTTTPNAGSLYRVSLGFMPPTPPQRSATLVRVLVTWPALSDTQSHWPTTFSGSLNTTVGLDRN